MKILANRTSLKDTRVLQVDGLGSLAGVTSVVPKVKRGADVQTLAGAVVSEVERTVSVDFGGTGGWLEDAAVGVWELQIRLTWNDGTSLVWPDGRPALVDVGPAHA